MAKGKGKGGVESTTLQSMRIFVILINVVTSIAAFGLIALGIYTFSRSDLVLYSKAIPTTLVVVGILVFVVSFVGCLGASIESHRLLKIYFVVLLLLVLAQVGIIVLTSTNVNKVDETLDKAWQKAYDCNPRIISDIENEYSCCGYRNVTDRAFPKKHPDSCVNSPNFGYEDACYDQIISRYKAHRTWIGLVAGIIGLIQVFSLGFTYNLIRRLPSEREREARYREEYDRLVNAARDRQPDTVGNEYGSLTRGTSNTDPENLP